MIILDEDSSIGSGQLEKDCDCSEETEIAKADNYEYDNEPELQETEDKGQVLGKQTDDNEETESDETYDSELDDGFIVHNGNRSQHVFKPSKKGLYYSDVTNNVRTTLVTTVDSTRNKYSVRQYSNARKARLLQSTIGRPSTEDLFNI